MSVLVYDGPRHTHAELAAVAGELFDTLYQGYNLGVSVTEVRISPEGTHVDVGVWPLPSASIDPQQAAAQAQSFWARYFPVAVTAVPPAPVASRWQDVTPWSAGGKVTSGGSWCSTGWPMTAVSGARYLLTAAHCAVVPYGTPVRDGLGTAVIGTIEGIDASLDTALIKVRPPADVNPRTWDGGVSDVRQPLGVNDDIESMKPIVDWNNTFRGMYLCTSGSATGAHCNIKVKDADVSYTNDIGWKVKGSALGKQVDGTVALGKGDSGGPIFLLYGERADAVAIGVIAAGDAYAVLGCGAHPSPECYSKVRFTKISAIRTNWALSNVIVGGSI
jgi:hypothetical protein